MELHVKTEGDNVSVQATGKISEAREHILPLVKDIDATVVGPRLKQLTEDLKPYVGR